MSTEIPLFQNDPYAVILRHVFAILKLTALDQVVLAVNNLAFSDLYFAKSLKTTCSLTSYFFLFLEHLYISGTMRNLSSLKVMKGFILASDIWVSIPKLMCFANFLIFKLLVDEDMHAIERYFFKLLLVVKLVPYSVKKWFCGIRDFDVKFDKKKLRFSGQCLAKIVIFLLALIYLRP